MSGHSTILFLTQPEYGQSNIHLAVIEALRQHHGTELDIHIASLSPLDKRKIFGATVHVLPGKCMFDYCYERIFVPGANLYREFCTQPGLWGTLKASKVMSSILYPGPPEEYLTTSKAAVNLIKRIQPELVVLDNLFDAGIDAANEVGCKWVILSPNPYTYLAAPQQGTGIVSLPFTNLGYAYPLTWIEKIFNVIALFWAPIWLLLFDARAKRLQRAREKAGLKGPLPIFAPKEVPHICVSVPPLDYPGVIPPSYLCCGPIVRPSLTPDKGLNTWIKQRPTVLVSFGSNYMVDKKRYDILLAALQNLLEIRTDIQVLWKLKVFGTYDITPSTDRLKITDWLATEPSTLLRSGAITCFVHHGGSNSFHEAISAGVPQIILSCWFDTHDFGARAEYLGVGKWGNKRHAHEFDAQGFYDALLEVVGIDAAAQSADTIRTRAKECSDTTIAYQRTLLKSDHKGEDADAYGREIAAEHLWKMLKPDEMHGTKA